MKRTRIAALCVVATLGASVAMSTVATAPASAFIPITWKTGPAKWCFKFLGRKICFTFEDRITITIDPASRLEGTNVLEGTEVEEEGVKTGTKCQSAEAKAGQVNLEPVAEELGFVKGAKAEVGLEERPQKGETLAKFTCGANAVEVKGGVIGAITPINKRVTPSEAFHVAVTTTEEKQAITKFEGGPTVQLEGQLNGGGFQPGTSEDPGTIVPKAPEEISTASGSPEFLAIVPHYYGNLSKEEEGKPVPYISWGKLSLTSSKGGSPVECENAVGGYDENPVGGGAGVEATNGWTAYNCTDAECEAAGGHIGVIFENEKTPGQSLKLEWPGELTEVKAGTIRLKSTNVRVYTHCQFVALPSTERPGTGPFTGLEEKETKEYNAPGSTICTTTAPGASEPKLKNGTNAEKPSKTEFDGVGFLECGTGGKGITGGTLKTIGFNESETIDTKNP